MQNQSTKGAGDEPSLRTTANLLAVLCYCHATCFTPFLRWGFGAEALGFNGIGALLILLGTAGFAPEPRLFSVAFYWFIALVIHRAKFWWDAASGRIVHSRYSGYPLLATLCGGRVWFAKWVLEPTLCLGLGNLLSGISPRLGDFFVLGAGSLLAVQVLELRLDQIRLRQMRDSQIEQQYMAEMYRNQRF